MEIGNHGKKHLLVVSQYFYPEQFRVNDICAEWVLKKYKVTVITGIPNYPKGKFYDGYGLFSKREEKYKGIDIIRLPLIPRGNNSVMLVLNYLSFAIAGYFWHLFTRIDADIVYIYQLSPISAALPGVWYAKKKKKPCLMYVTDLWPESVESVTGLRNKFILGMIGRMVDSIYRRCDRIFTSSTSFIEAIRKRGVPEDKLKFWPSYAEDFYVRLSKEDVSVPEIPQDGRFNIIFAGNIGVAQGLDVLPGTAKLLRQDGIHVRFSIVGDGRFKTDLKKLVHENDLSDMFNFVDRQFPQRIPSFFAVCDAVMICLAKNELFSMTIPAKTQSCLACGKPIIVSADGEVQKIVAEAKAGIVAESGNAEMLAEKIRELISKSNGELAQMGDSAYGYYKSHFDKKALLDDMDKEFERLSSNEMQRLRRSG